MRQVDGGHTTVELTMTADPVSMSEGFREMLGERHPAAQLELQRLEAYVKKA
jgi:hypothetical protein